MKSFRTLKGFVTGDEPEGVEPTFSHHATLRIFSEGELDFQELNAVLTVIPTTTRRRGEQIGQRSPPVKGDLWMYRAPVAEDRDLHEHIDALWSVLKPNASFLRALKSRASVEVILGYSSNIDHAGFRLPHESLEMFGALALDFSVHIIVLPDCVSG